MERRIAHHSLHGNPPIYKNSEFQWALEIERDWHLIREELMSVLKRRDELPSFHEVVKEVSTITSDNNWKTFMFYGYGVAVEENIKACPNTAKLLQKIPGMKTAFFSILSPGKHIPAHRGPYNGVLRYHLGLVVPEPKEKCRIRIDEEIANWDEGESLIFDDSFDHEVWNETEGVRVVLFVDFVRPLSFPFNLMNRFILNAAMFSSYIQESSEKMKAWEKQFYAKQNGTNN